MKAIKNCILLFIFMLGCLFAGGKAHAQRTLIEAKIDSAAILIGEQTHIHLTVVTDKGRAVQMLVPVDTIVRGVEVLDISAPDTSLIENDRIVIRQDLLITSFDSDLYSFPPFRVVDGVDTVYSKGELGLKVVTVEVDTEKPEEFYDIAGIWKPPFVLSDYYLIIYSVLIGLFLICVIGYVIERIKNKKPVIPFAKEKPKLPPHEQAIHELDRIKLQKLWQQGRNKEYYTLVTETLRKYIVERFSVYAMEMTSAEILAIIRRENEADSVYDNLKQVLLLADFVKFAKFNPLPDENELSMMNAYLFVNQTKQADFPPAGAPEDESDNNEQTTYSTLTKEET
ncbi:hypothetical protein FACS1894181_00490 [Bacteroidia bacterium]|nr:hypothetical protein FACS1894181_00490 [Bacteroidia bacterium]